MFCRDSKKTSSLEKGRDRDLSVAGLCCIAQGDEAAFAFALTAECELRGWSLASRTRFVELQVGRGKAVAMRVVSQGQNDRQMQFVCLIQQADETLRSPTIQFVTVRCEFLRGGSGAVELEVSGTEQCTPHMPVSDFTLGKAGVVCLHSDGTLTARIAGTWNSARSASVGWPDAQRVEGSWDTFCDALRRDPLVTDTFLRVTVAEFVAQGLLESDIQPQSREQFVGFIGEALERNEVKAVAVFHECLRQYRIGSSLSRVGDGLPVLVGFGGVSVVIAVPPICLWPDVNMSGARKAPSYTSVLSCCSLADVAVSPEQWSSFDVECVAVGPEEACLSVMNYIAQTPLPLELPLSWGEMPASETKAAVRALLSDVEDWGLPREFWAQALSGSSISSSSSPASSLSLTSSGVSSGGAASLHGPFMSHIAACAIRCGAEGAYRVTRALLTTCYTLLASQSLSVTRAQREALRSELIPRAAGVLRHLACLRAALRVPSDVGKSIVPVASACHILSRPLTQLARRYSGGDENALSALVPSFALCAWFLASNAVSAVLLMRALHLSKEYSALARIAAAPGALPSAIRYHFSGLSFVHRGELDTALECFSKAVAAAECRASETLVSLHGFSFLDVAADKAAALDVDFPPDRYWQTVVTVFEAQNHHHMVVKAARLALRRTQNPGIFWGSCFRHNMLLRNYAEAYMDVQAANSFAEAHANGNPASLFQAAEVLVRRLRKFVVDVVNNGDSDVLCQFPFVGRHIGLVSEILSELASLSDVDQPECNYYEILHAFFVYRGNYRQAAACMHEYATRLRVESHAADALEHVSSALSAALSALRLSPPHLQWIAPTGRSFASSSTDGLSGAQEPVLKRSQVGMSTSSLASLASAAGQGAIQDDVLSLRTLEEEYAMVSARASLRHCAAPVGPSDAFTLLIANGRIGQALSLGSLFRLDLSPAFDVITRRALGLQTGGSLLGGQDDEWADFVDEGEKPWTVVQRLVEHYDSRQSNFAYARAVAMTVLADDAGLRVPAWLTDYLRKNNAESLLELLLTHGRLDEAFVLLMQLLHDEKKVVPLPILDKMLQAKSLSDQKKLAVRRALGVQ